MRRVHIRGATTGPDAIMDLRARSWTDVTRSTRRLEAADRFGEKPFWQPKHHFWKEHAEGNRQQEHDVKRQRSYQRVTETDADVFRRHQQRQSIRRRD